MLINATRRPVAKDRKVDKDGTLIRLRRSIAMTRAVNSDAQVEKLITGILSMTRDGEADKFAAWKKPSDDIRRLVRHDYVRSLRRNLPYREIKTLVEAFAQVVPSFNREPIGELSPERLAAWASDLGLHFKAAPYAGDDGLALRGFYVTRAHGMLKRPLIYVNTAHHPLAVCSTFCHEVGHHMSAEMLGEQNDLVHFFFDADYAAHLEDPCELAADVMVSFAAYPEPIARKIFAVPWRWGLVAQAKDLTEAALAEVVGHLKRFYGFNLMERIPAPQKLNYLSGMIHFAKLRWALLAEYDI
ncbi:MAG TPA: hypothetical protein VNF29_12785 [Candidatus Binataceae bacterium]|nr:hypothetical protein [Candidatus Binataceae bacterium]HVC45022.1 hypothetical protein [Candidatus Binataceae bacterium]